MRLGGGGGAAKSEAPPPLLLFLRACCRQRRLWLPEAMSYYVFEGQGAGKGTPGLSAWGRLEKRGGWHSLEIRSQPLGQDEAGGGLILPGEGRQAGEAGLRSGPIILNLSNGKAPHPICHQRWLASHARNEEGVSPIGRKKKTLYLCTTTKQPLRTCCKSPFDWLYGVSRCLWGPTLMEIYSGGHPPTKRKKMYIFAAMLDPDILLRSNEFHCLFDRHIFFPLSRGSLN